MAYDVSKKINVGLMKIYAKLADNLYLRKFDAEKQYLALSGGTMTGDTVFDTGSVFFKKLTKVSKIGQDENQNLNLYSDNNVKFSTLNATYFTASPSYLSLENKHNNIAVELVNEEGSGSPYGGLTVYDTKTGAPELISAINSGVSDGEAYQSFATKEDGSFIWSLFGDEDVSQIAKIDRNGLTLINKDDFNNELSGLAFQSNDGSVAEITSLSGDMRLNASEIMLNSVASIGQDSIDLLGGRAIEFDSANDGVKMYSDTNSNILTLDFKGQKLTFDEDGFNGNATSADEATKLSAERTVSGGSDILLNYKYDGSGDSTAEIGFYSCNAQVGNKNNYPFHRFAKIDLTSENYEDWTTTLYISQGYNQGGFGICRISLRTNGIGVNSQAEVKWLCRNGLSADFVQIGIDHTINATHADAFIKINAAYASTTIRAIASESRGEIEHTWTLISSYEVNNTDTSTKRGSLECYKSIEDAANEIHGEAYSATVVGEEAIAERASKDSEGRQINSTYIAGIEAYGANTIKITYGDGHQNILSIPTS